MAQERYFLYVDGVQRGPYTVGHIGHMVNSGIVHESAMFWCEGLEQWQPVTQLIVPKGEKKRRRLHLSAGLMVALAVGLLLLWLLFPTLKEGWREQHQVERTPLAAYWSARGVLRSHLGWFAAPRFAEFNPAQVFLSENGTAIVTLEAEVARGGFAGRRGRWQVDLRYDKRLRAWRPDANASPRDPALPSSPSTASPPVSESEPE